MIKVELLLAGEFDASELVGGAGVRATEHDPSLLAGLAHGEATEAAPPFRYLVELAASSLAAALELVEWTSARLGGVDRARSTVVAGPEFTVVPGDEVIMLGMALTRRPDLTRDEFIEHWSTTHAELGRAVPGSEGYRQVHLDADLTGRARDVLGFGGPQFDGVAIAYYSSQSAFESILANAEITSTLLEDERRFIDHVHAAMVVGRS